MKVTAFLIKYCEIAIKGKNRYMFEDALMKQIRHAMAPVGDFKVRKESGRMFVEAQDEFDYDEAVEALQRVFGIVGICPMIIEENKDMETIMRELSNRDQQNQGFFCSYEIFKYFYELLLKMSVRNEQNYYLIMLQFSDGTLDYEKVGVDFDRVKRLVSSCLRSNDLFTRTSETQLLLLVDCQTEENAHLIIQRISNKFYSIFRKKNYRMNYSVHKAELDRNR